MKQYITNSYSFLKEALFDDILDRYLLLSSIILFLVDYLIWQSFFIGEPLSVLLRINIYPIKYLAIIMALNTLLSISAHDKEKEVGYLLLIGNIIVGILIFILEIFYLVHLS
jgi:hypothetical protein